MGPSFLYLHSDARILDQIRKGDEEALVTLYEANRRTICSLVTRNRGSQDEAEDMLQESLVILWERVRSGRFQYAARLSTFLYATAKNLWSRRLAQKQREIPSELSPDDYPDETTDPMEEMIRSEEAGAVRDALGMIGDQCRKLLYLFYWEEQSMDKIAVQMGFANADTVKAKKYQCKKRLEQILLDWRKREIRKHD